MGTSEKKVTVNSHSDSSGSVLSSAPTLCSLRSVSFYLKLSDCTASGGSLLIPALETFSVKYAFLTALWSFLYEKCFFFFSASEYGAFSVVHFRPSNLVFSDFPSSTSRGEK